MSVRSLTVRLNEERSEARRRSTSASPGHSIADLETPEVFQPRPSALYKGKQPTEIVEAPPEPPKPSGLKPRVETPSAAIPGGIADRFRLRSQRASELSRSIDAYTSQLTAASPESEDGGDDPDSDTAPITIELQSH